MTSFAPCSALASLDERGVRSFRLLCRERTKTMGEKEGESRYPSARKPPKPRKIQPSSHSGRTMQQRGPRHQLLRRKRRIFLYSERARRGAVVGDRNRDCLRIWAARARAGPSPSTPRDRASGRLSQRPTKTPYCGLPRERRRRWARAGNWEPLPGPSMPRERASDSL